MSKSWQLMYEDAIRARRDDKARIAELEAALRALIDIEGPQPGHVMWYRQVCELLGITEETKVDVTGGGAWANGQAPYVCDLPYLPESNALANCKTCGWPIAKHNMVDQFAKGPFAPKTKGDDNA